jgi:hypothetical protein
MAVSSSAFCTGASAVSVVPAGLGGLGVYVGSVFYVGSAVSAVSVISLISAVSWPRR